MTEAEKRKAQIDKIKDDLGALDPSELSHEETAEILKLVFDLNRVYYNRKH